MRALFPRWDFFDRVAYHFEVGVKVPGAADWTLISFEQRPRAWGLVLNPAVNEALAQVNILEHFVRDIQELQAARPDPGLDDIQGLTSYHMLTSLLRTKLRGSDAGERIQFRITAVSPEERVDLFISHWISWEAP